MGWCPAPWATHLLRERMRQRGEESSPAPKPLTNLPFASLDASTNAPEGSSRWARRACVSLLFSSATVQVCCITEFCQFHQLVLAILPPSLYPSLHPPAHPATGPWLLDHGSSKATPSLTRRALFVSHGPREFTSVKHKCEYWSLDPRTHTESQAPWCRLVIPERGNRVQGLWTASVTYFVNFRPNAKC